MDNLWRIVQPVTSYNYTLNPSAEITGNYSAVSGVTINRVTTQQKYGLYSYEVVATVANQGIQLTTKALTNVEHFVTVRARGNTNLKVSLGGVVKPLTFLEKIDNYWSLFGAAYSKAQSTTQTSYQILVTKSGTVYLDGAQIEPLPYWTTYIDGTQEDCTWQGVSHASISERSGASRAGGRCLDLYTAYGFLLEKVVGGASAPHSIGVDSYAQLPGGILNYDKVNSRDIALIGTLYANTDEELRNKHADLEFALTSDDYQLTRLRFNNPSQQKEIAVRYAGGMDGDLPIIYDESSTPGDAAWTKLFMFREKLAIQLTAPDPYWYEVGEHAASLDTNDSATFTVIAARLKSTGQWSALGPPNAAGTYTAVQSIAEDAQYIYFGGDFLNFDNIANADRIVRYDKLTGTYSAMGTGANGVVTSIAIAPNGYVWAAGAFTSIGGVAANRIAYWDGAAWNAVGTGTDSDILAMVIGLDGKVYIGGVFSAAGGVANTLRLAYWDGSAWNAIGVGSNNTIYALALGIEGYIYIGGEFTSIAGVAANRIAYWNGSTIVAMGSGSASTISNIAVDPTKGIVYVVGSFTSIGGVAANRIAGWGGSSWFALGSGFDTNASELAIGPDGVVYAGGIFTAAGGLYTANRLARWNGYAWAHLDIDLPGTPVIYSLMASRYADPIIKQKYDVYVGFNTSGTGNYAGKTAIVNGGNIPVAPKIVYTRSAGTTAIVQTLRNEDTGKELLFNYSLLSGETLTVDLMVPTRKSITSSFFGPKNDAVLAASNFNAWKLKPGTQNVTSFIATSGSPTITAYLLWRNTYSGY